jgi:hypothetical protein
MTHETIPKHAQMAYNTVWMIMSSVMNGVNRYKIIDATMKVMSKFIQPSKPPGEQVNGSIEDSLHICSISCLMYSAALASGSLHGIRGPNLSMMVVMNSCMYADSSGAIVMVMIYLTTVDTRHDKKKMRASVHDAIMVGF